MDPTIRPIIRELMAKWANRDPQAAERIARAEGLVEHCTSLGYGAWAVRGSNRGAYLVKVDPRARTATCNCIDFHKGHKCKHIWAVALLYQAQRTRQRKPSPRPVDPHLEEVPGGWVVVYLGRALCGTDLYRYLGPKEKARVFPEQKGLLQKVSREVDFRSLPTEVEVLLQRGRIP